MLKRLISIEEAEVATHQHKSPCGDCPFARTALHGWLGGVSVDDWVHIAHNDINSDCHTKIGAQCAGIAIYRRNTCKSVRSPLLTLEADHKTCFSNQMEFREHHNKRGLK